MKSEYKTVRNKDRFSEVRRELGCSYFGVAVCGRMVAEKQKYAQLEEELKRTEAEKEKYRIDFEMLLGLVNSSIRQNLVIETFKQRMSEIREIKSVYCLRRKNVLSFSVFMNEENWDVEDEVFNVYGELIDNFEEFDIRVKVLRLWGRKEDEILAVGGFRLLG
jgi:hypothetical protein